MRDLCKIAELAEKAKNPHVLGTMRWLFVGVKCCGLPDAAEPLHEEGGECDTSPTDCA